MELNLLFEKEAGGPYCSFKIQFLATTKKMKVITSLLLFRKKLNGYNSIFSMS